MKEAKIIAKGDIDDNAWYAHVFKKPDGSLVEEECTSAEYKALAVSSANNPVRENMEWVYSYSDNRLDTESGRLEDDMFYEVAEGKYQTKINGKVEVTLEKPKSN